MAKKQTKNIPLSLEQQKEIWRRNTRPLTPVELEHALRHIRLFDENLLKHPDKLKDDLEYIKLRHDKRPEAANSVKAAIVSKIFFQGVAAADKDHAAEIQKAAEATPTCTLCQFIEKNCELPSHPYIKSKVILIFRRAKEGRFEFPPLAKEHKTGQAKIFYEADLRRKWPTYCKEIPTLYKLKTPPTDK